jgi:hypothetical protein
MSSGGLVAILAHKAGYGRTNHEVDHRLLGQELLLSFLNVVFHDVDLIDGLRMRQTPLAQAGLCPIEPDISGVCKCLSTALAWPVLEGETAPHQYFARVCVGFLRSANCPAIKSRYHELLEDLDTLATARIFLFTQPDPMIVSAAHLNTRMLTHEGHSLVKRRRIDEDFSQAFVVAVMRQRRARSVRELARMAGSICSTTAAAWLPQTMAEYRASMLLTFVRPQNCSFSYDGGRFGQPKEETVLGPFEDCDTGIAKWLPIQA